MADPPYPKLDDFNRNPEYERKLVIFCDVLGWRQAIIEAGRDIQKIGDLRRCVLEFLRMAKLPSQPPLRVTTFSDNIVLSMEPLRYALPALLRRIAWLQVMKLNSEIFLRGGITVGDIIHDDEIVFGPALVRAYDLERELAKFPRFVVDAEVLKLAKFGTLINYDGQVHFLDPFTLEFVESYINEIDPDFRNPAIAEVGLPVPTPQAWRELKQFHPYERLAALLDPVRRRLRMPLRDKEWEKIAWLHDLIASRVGMALASSYPRVLPDDLVG